MSKYLLIMSQKVADQWGFTSGEMTTIYPGTNEKNLEEGEAEVVIEEGYDTPIIRRRERTLADGLKGLK